MSQFVKAAHVKDVTSESPTCVTVGDEDIALFRQGDTYYAIGNTCTHQGGPLCEGELKDGEIECPWHGAHFRLSTGEATGPPAVMNVPCYNVRVTGDQIEIEV